MWRAALAVDLAFLATGYDEPYAPAGMARLFVAGSVEVRQDSS